MAHNVTRTEGKTGYCGDHYCTGHTKVTWTCDTCGWSSSNEDTNERRLSHIEYATGI